MLLTRRQMIAATAGLVAVLPLSSAQAAPNVVKVSLWDKGAGSMDMLGKGPMRGMGMMKDMMSGKNMMSGKDNKAAGKMGMAMMGIDAAPATTRAGKITFEVANVSKDIVHEMVLAKVTDDNKPLPYDKANEKVDEDAAGHLGEVAELEPGQSGALTLTLKPGKYILYCNIPGHYVLGMWTLFTVTA